MRRARAAPAPPCRAKILLLGVPVHRPLRQILRVWGVLCIGCTPLAPRLAHLQRDITALHTVGGPRCAAALLAQAESHADFAAYELDAGDAQRAWQHTAVAEEALQRGQVAPCCQGQLGPDRDHDGIVDRLDKCPDEPEDQDGFQDADGCPDPDNDGDTVLDAIDRCPLQAGDPKHAGCPLSDRDGDGIPDDVDLCPDIAEDIDGVADADGCPEDENPDLDNDGILNDVDACPTAAEDKDGFRDEDGCPDPDNDLDGVLDAVDACPLQPGAAAQLGCPTQDRDHDGVNDDVDSCPDLPAPPPSGCPKKVLVLKTNDRIEITQQINFAAGKALIRRNDLSYEIISQVAQVLKANPGIHIQIEGHTDTAGPAERNLKLSDDRARAVRQAVIDKGIEPARLDAIGYGESKPLVTNDTAIGRSKNRRVVFNIVQSPQPMPHN